MVFIMEIVLLPRRVASRPRPRVALRNTQVHRPRNPAGSIGGVGTRIEVTADLPSNGCPQSIVVSP